VLFVSPDGQSGWTGGGSVLTGAPISWFGQAAVESGGDTSAGVGAQGQHFRIVSTMMDGALNFVPVEILYAEERRFTQATLMRLQTDSTVLGRAAYARLAEAKKDSTVLGRAAYARLAAAQHLIDTDPTAWRRAKQAEATAAEAAQHLIDTDPTAWRRAKQAEATAAKDEAWRAAGSFVSSLVSAAPDALSGIIALGNAIVNVVLPPRQLPPPYVPPSSLTPPPPPYVPPSSLTYTPTPVPTLRAPPYVAPSSLTQTPKPKAPPYVAPSSLTQTPKPKAPPPPPPRTPPPPPRTPTTTPGVTRLGGLPTGPQR
jgi:hypothetical protein